MFPSDKFRVEGLVTLAGGHVGIIGLRSLNIRFDVFHGMMRYDQMPFKEQLICKQLTLTRKDCGSPD